ASSRPPCSTSSYPARVATSARPRSIERRASARFEFLGLLREKPEEPRAGGDVLRDADFAMAFGFGYEDGGSGFEIGPRADVVVAGPALRAAAQYKPRPSM